MWFILCMWQCPTNITDYNGAQTCTIILWRTGWCNTLSRSDGVLISACSTGDFLCTHILSNQPTSTLLVANPPLGPLLQHQLQSAAIESLTLKPTAYFKFRPCGSLTQSYYIKVCWCGMRTFKESTNNLKMNYIMTWLQRYYSHLYTHKHTHKPFASLIDLKLNVDIEMAETGSWHWTSGSFDTHQLPDTVLPHAYTPLG